MTSGCTKQACGFAERYPQFQEKGAVILGVSKDSVASHKRFEEKYGLPFTLLADPEKTARIECNRYGAVSVYEGYEAITCVSDEGDGMITAIMRKV